MILTSTQARIEGYEIKAYKGIVQGETWNELLRHAEALGANAVINTCFDNALDVETVFHGSAVVVEPLVLYGSSHRTRRWRNAPGLWRKR